MGCFIKKIFEGRIDNLVHLQLVKFSRGEFKDRALANASKSKDKYSLSTGPEYANELVRMMANKIENEKTKVTGVIVSTRNLKEIPEFNKLFTHVEVKQFMGIKQFKIDKDMLKEEIIQICNLLPTSFLALSFSVKDSELKIKPKAPKSAKPSTSEKKTVPDFCKLKTNDISLIKEILFDVDPSSFKKVEILHDFIITEIEIPKGETNTMKMRENAIRKGKVIRKMIVDGKFIQREAGFEA